MFIISERQYNIIMQQAQACYPQETGGVLGGRQNTILGVLPIPNKHLYNRTDTFAITDEDISTGYKFLEKHGLEYLGIYHTHPQGVAVPSAQDLSHNQKYHFIVSLRDRYNPEFRAWRVEDNKLYPENIRVISDMGITVVDIHTGRPKLSENATKEALGSLANMINEMIQGKRPHYPILEPTNWDASSFSTLA